MNTNPVILYSKRFDRDFNEILRYLRQNFSESAANVVLDKVLIQLKN
jgi:hypothetical protein